MIVQYPDEILRKTSELVADGEIVADVVGLMKQELDKTNGLGIAAVQIGVLKSIIIIRDVSTGVDTMMINPKIMGLGDGSTVKSEEGCLSFAEGKPRATIKRYKSIQIAYKDLLFQQQVQFLEGLPAIVAQHETDHTAGIMFLDHLSRLKKSMLLKKIKT